MKKDFFYVAVGIFIIVLCVLCCCVISATVSYNDDIRTRKKKTVSIKAGPITYEAEVNSTYDAAMTYWRLKRDCTKAMVDEQKEYEEEKALEEELDRLRNEK